MVLAVTLNPLLEKKYFFRDTSSDKCRASHQKLLAGGKGINVSRQLNALGIKNHSMTFLGGPNGKKMRAILENENISFSAVNTKSETREASLIFDEKQEKLKTYFGINSAISDFEINSFLSKLEKAVINSSIVVFSGSLPNDESSAIIERGIELCNNYDKISILDSYGEHLESQISSGPTIIHNNLKEIESSFDVQLNDEEDIRNFLKMMYEKGVKLSFLTSGESYTYAAKSNFHYKISNPKINEKDSTGSGDAFVAGIIYGLEKSLIFNDFVKIAASLGSRNASVWDVCNISLDEAMELVNDVTISEIGKKIKLIDDSPTI